MTTRRWSTVQAVGLALIAGLMLPAGLQAAFLPRSFFDDFPFGRGWIAAEGGAYDEHLVRDVGILLVALVIVTVWAIWRRPVARPVAVAWVVQGVFHAAYHALHLGGDDVVDQVGLLASLFAIPVLAGLVLWADHKAPSWPAR